MRLLIGGRLRKPHPEIEYTRVLEAVVSNMSGTSEDARRKVLFVCSRNQWRSPTAENVWRSHPKFAVRSAGTSPNARRHVSPKDISWAEVIFVMEQKHKSRLVAEYPRLLEHKPIHVLDIPDDYKYMDPDLVQALQRSVGAILGFE